jgi:hypothetical protein
MTKEMEVLTADALAARPTGVRRETHAAPADCPNCGYPVSDRYCGHCGQSANLRHRSILHLIWEAFEGLFHLDGRLWRTVPALFFRPGTLNKDFLEGRIARHVPPFRMFLVALVIFIFSAEATMHRIQESPHGVGKFTVDGQTVTGRAQAVALARRNAAARYAEDVSVAERLRDQTLKDTGARGGAEAGYQRAMQAAARRRDGELGAAAAWENMDKRASPSFSRGLAVTAERPEYYITVLFQWAHRLVLLLLPIVAAFLTLAYAFQRRFYVYDHLIVAMNYLSFLFLLFAAAILPPGSMQTWALIAATLWSPVNLFMILRGAYGSSIVWAVVKATAIFLATAASFLALVAGILIFTFTQL